MRIEKLRVQGFRLLEDVELLLEPGATVIVGRNNSGKTSLTEIFDRLAGEQGPRFRLEDFSAGTRPRFEDAYSLRRSGARSTLIHGVSLSPERFWQAWTPASIRRPSQAAVTQSPA